MKTGDVLKALGEVRSELKAGQDATLAAVQQQGEVLRLIAERLGLVLEKLYPEESDGPNLQELLAELVGRTGDNTASCDASTSVPRAWRSTCSARPIAPWRGLTARTATARTGTAPAPFAPTGTAGRRERERPRSMMTFRKLAAESAGKLIRAYFTENTPQPDHDFRTDPGSSSTAAGASPRTTQGGTVGRPGARTCPLLLRRRWASTRTPCPGMPTSTACSRPSARTRARPGRSTSEASAPST